MTRLLLLLLLPFTLAAQTYAPNLQQFIAYPGGKVAITDVTIYDGTGAAPKLHQTIVLEGGVISSVGTQAPPADAKVINGTGKTVIPGLVMLHEHLYY